MNVGYSEFDKYAIENYDANFPGRINFGDITKIDETQLPDFNMIIGGSPCFIAGTLIMTSSGYKKIEDIVAGDKVLTHTNSYQKVLTPMINKADHIYKISTMCSEDLFVTEEHPFYVRKRYKNYHPGTKTYTRDFAPPCWIKAKDLSKDYYVGIATNQKSELPKWGGIKKTINQFTIEDRNDISAKFNNPNFWWVIGRYIGDGWTNLHKRKNRKDSFGYKTIICCSKFKNEVEDITNKLRGLFNYSVCEERTTYKINIGGQELYEYLQQFGKYAYGKHLTEDIINLPKDLLRSFIEGYFSADGWIKKESNNLYTCCSASREFIYGLGQCVVKAFNRPYSIYKTTPKQKTVIEGRLVNQREQWLLRFKKDAKAQDKAFYDGEYAWCPITNIDSCEYEGAVYNMEVENDNSYTVNNIIVHNCQNISILRKTWTENGKPEGLNGEESKLFFDYVRILNHKLPQNFIFENVRNLLNSNDGEDFEVVKEMFQENYNIKFQLINTADYNLPQTRRRLYIIGQRKDLGDFNYEFPKPVELKSVAQDLLDYVVDDKYYLSEAMYATVMSWGTGGWKAKPEADLKIARPLTATMHKMHRASTDNYYHTEYKPQGKTNLRRLNPRECARLQGLSDDYKIVVSDTQAYRLMGNAMSLNVVRAIVLQLNNNLK